MKDSFSEIIQKMGATGATGATNPLNTRNSKTFEVVELVTPAPKLRGDTPVACPYLLSDEIRYLYQERIGIYIYDGKSDSDEAQYRAFQCTLQEFINQCYPKIMVEFESIINTIN